MATYIPGISDAVPETPLYHPDMGFFNQMLMRKTQMYNQGLSQVQSAYSSVLNAPLSDQQNIDARNDYVRQAQDKLKDLSKTDLSLDANVQAADNVFAPFWQDDIMLKDASYTKQAQTEMQKGLSFMNSPDENVRSQYSNTAMRYIDQGLDQLRNAGRDPNAYAKLQTRRFVPFQNIPGTLSKQLKDEGYEVDNNYASNGYIVKKVNGVDTKENYLNWAIAHMTPQMSEQMMVTASVAKQDSINTWKTYHPGSTDMDALSGMAKDEIGGIQKSYQTQLDNLTSYRQKLKNDIDAYSRDGMATASADQATALAQSVAQLKTTQTNIDNISAEQAKYTGAGQSGYDDIYKKFTEDPDSYYVRKYQNGMLNDWATVAASNTKGSDIKEDTAYFSRLNIDARAKELQLESAKFSQTLQAFDWQKKKDVAELNSNSKSGKGAGIQYDANLNPVAGTGSDAPILNAQNYIGQDVQDPYKNGSPLEVYTKAIDDNKNALNSMITSPTQLSSVLSNLDPSINQQDIALMGNMLTKRLNDDKYMASDDESHAYQKIREKLVATLGRGAVGSTAGDLRNAILTYSEQYINGRMQQTHNNLNPQEMAVVKMNNDAQNLLNGIVGSENIRQNMMSKYLANSKDPDIQKLSVIRPNGQRDLVGEKDFASFLHPIIVKDNTGHQQVITPKQMASEISKGNELGLPHSVNTSGGPDYASTQELGYSINIDGKDYDVVNPENSRDMKANFIKRFGTVADINQNLKKAYQDVIPNLPVYQQRTGSLGSIFQLDVDKEKAGAHSEATQVLQQLSDPQNFKQMMYDGKPLQNTPDATAILQALSSHDDGERRLFDHVRVHTKSEYDGQPSVEVTFASNIGKDDKRKFNGVDLTDLAGHKIEFLLNPNAQSPALQKIQGEVNDYQVHQDMTNGKNYTSPQIQQATGYNATITNDAYNHGVYTGGTRKVFDANSGRMIDVPIPTQYIPYSQKSPDEIYKMYYGDAWQAHVQEDQANRARYYNNVPPAATSGKTFNDILKELNYTK